MSRINTILVPVDFGDASARAIAAAGVLARQSGATLQLLHAEPLEAPAYFTHEQLDAIEHQRSRMRAQAEAFLTRFGKAHTSSPFTSIIDDQPPAEAILRRARAADLVVMGTHGRRGPSRWWLGSVTERMLHHLERPLLVVKAGDAVDGLFSHILVQATQPLKGDVALDWARALAGAFGGAATDARTGEPHVDLGRATLLVVAAPSSYQAVWLSNTGEPLITRAGVPVLFAPEPAGAVEARVPRAGEPS